MPLRIAYHARCDCPRCPAGFLTPAETTWDARAELALNEWTIVRWRQPKSGVKRTRYGDSVEVKDTGGPGRILTLCPEHRHWRPVRGREMPLPKRQRKKRRR